MNLEILAPAGGQESAYVAIAAGANAIYLGLTSFSARSSAENFNRNQLVELLQYAHALNVHVHVAMNTLIKQSELQSFLQTAVDVWNCGVDAIIIQDIFVGKYLKQMCPQMVLHLSTQAGTCNVYGARLAKRYGFDRVILARETKLADIEQIAQIIETECFVQGALCTCFSGQCFMSSFAGGNSGNRGRCKQPCRKRYTINRSGFEKKSYAISLSDLNIGEDIRKLIDAGVVSFKIEGRMRRPEYVSAAVSYYRHIIDGCVQEDDLIKLKRTYNRGNYTKGLAFNQQKGFISSAVQGHIGEFVGIVKVENKKYICQSPQFFEKGDCFKILRNGLEVGGAVYGGNVKGGFYLESKIPLKNADKVFITTDISLNQQLLDLPKRLRPIQVEITLKVGDKPIVNIQGITIQGDDKLDKAIQHSLTIEEVVKNFKKVDAYPFMPYVKVQIEGDIFMPISQLNALRRKAYDFYAQKITVDDRKLYNVPDIPQIKKVEANSKLAIIGNEVVDTADINIYKPQKYSDICNFCKNDKVVYLYLPPFMTSAELEQIKPYINHFDGIYCDNYFGMQVAYEWGKLFFAGTGFHLANTIGVDTVEANYFALSKEISLAESKLLCRYNSFILTAGDIKVMDLIYCPFGKTCIQCDKRDFYTLIDEDNREFIMRCYGEFSNCRFEVFNCAKLITEQNISGVLLDSTTLKNGKKLVYYCQDINKLKEFFDHKYTKGHSQLSVF